MGGILGICLVAEGGPTVVEEDLGVGVVFRVMSVGFNLHQSCRGCHARLDGLGVVLVGEVLAADRGPNVDNITTLVGEDEEDGGTAVGGKVRQNQNSQHNVDGKARRVLATFNRPTNLLRAKTVEGHTSLLPKSAVAPGQALYRAHHQGRPAVLSPPSALYPTMTT